MQSVKSLIFLFNLMDVIVLCRIEDGSEFSTWSFKHSAVRHRWLLSERSRLQRISLLLDCNLFYGIKDVC